MFPFMCAVSATSACHPLCTPTTLNPLLVLNLPAAVDGCRFCCTVLPLAIDHAARARCPRKYVQTQSCSRSRSRSQSASQLPQHGKRDSMFHVVFSWLWLWLWARYSFTKRYPFRCFAHINKHTLPPLFISLSHPLFPSLSHPFFHTLTPTGHILRRRKLFKF